MKPKVKMGNTAEGVRAKQIQGLSIIEAKSLRDGAEWNERGLDGKNEDQEDGLLMDERVWLDLKWKLEENIEHRHTGFTYIYFLRED